MNTRRPLSTPARRAYALLVVLVCTGIGLAALSIALSSVETNGTLTYRSNLYYTYQAAAEAATEKVLTAMARDYKNTGEATVFGNLGTYATLLPSTDESASWSSYIFSNAQGTDNRNYVQRVSTQQYVPLAAQYAGLSGFASTYKVISNARASGARFPVTGAVQQEIQLASIPIFQFAIFYAGDMELNGAAPMTVRGRVHGNANLFTGSASSQSFYNSVTVSGVISNGVRYGWALGGTVTYSGTNQTGVSTLNLPIGTNNSPAAVREVVGIPPSGEVIDSAMGRERYYNKAELVVLVSNATVTVGVKNPFDASYTPIPYAQCTNFLSTNSSFTDQREGKVVQTTQIDVANYTTWAGTNAAVIAKLGAGTTPNLIYVGDFRTETASKLDGVRLVNGQTLPSRGLTVATPNPLYTKGHFNQPTAGFLGTTNTSNTRPASLVSDAYTLLSGSFTDSASSSGYSSRTAADTTVVAAIVAGNVPSAGTYSGGVNNLPRLLEAWSGHTYTLDGSMVCLFNSAKATAPFQNPGVYYSAPSRNINFDSNFTDPTRLPPGTPSVRTLIRNKWAAPPPGMVSYVAP